MSSREFSRWIAEQILRDSERLKKKREEEKEDKIDEEKDDE
jgi:hypothetical protein